MISASLSPNKIRVSKAEKTLEIIFNDQSVFIYEAEYLRVESPSAEVQGHGPGLKTLVAGRRHVSIADVEAVGNYAIRIVFDDLHDTGIFSWQYLHRLGIEKEERWNRYLAALKDSGLRRDP